MSRRHRASCPSKNRQKKNAVERFHSVFLLVRVTGLEPARQGHQNLNLARLPIPPYPRVRLVYPFCGYLSILMMVLIGSGALAKRAESALTPRGRTRMDTEVSALVNPVSFIPNLAQTGDRQPLQKGERQRIFSTVGEHSVLPCRDIFAVSDTVLLHRQFTLRKRDIPVSRNSLVWRLWTAPTNLSI